MRTQIATNQSELARLCGVTSATISRHADAGVIPAGEVALGKRKYYSADQVEQIVHFYGERKRGETLGKFQYDSFGRADHNCRVLPEGSG